MTNYDLARQATKFLGGDWHGSYGMAPGPGHGKHDRSLKIAAHRLNADDIVLHSFASDDWRGVKDELRHAGILPMRGAASAAADPVAVKKKAAEVAKQQAEDAARRRWLPNQLWRLRQPFQGSLAEVYLREARGMRGLMLPPLDMLGFLPTGIIKSPPYPAMIAAHGIPDECEPGRLRLDEVSGVRLTFLDGPRKANVDVLDNGRCALGVCRSVPIVLAPSNDGLALCIAEGIETALSIHLARGIGAWAAGSANFMPPLADVVPDYIESVTIWAEKGKAGQDGARELQQRLTARGFEVRLAGVVSWLQ